MSIISDNISQDEIDKKVEIFRKWIKTESDLPQNIGKNKQQTVQIKK